MDGFCIKGLRIFGFVSYAFEIEPKTHLIGSITNKYVVIAFFDHLGISV